MFQILTKITEWLPSQDRVKWLALVKKVMNFRPPKMAGNYLWVGDSTRHRILMMAYRNRHDCVSDIVKYLKLNYHNISEKRSLSFFGRKVEGNLLSRAVYKDLFQVGSPFSFRSEDGDRCSLRNASGFSLRQTSMKGLSESARLL
jgi:hypothetical protein